VVIMIAGAVRADERVRVGTDLASAARPSAAKVLRVSTELWLAVRLGDEVLSERRITHADPHAQVRADAAVPQAAQTIAWASPRRSPTRPGVGSSADARHRRPPVEVSFV
jgi:hypothetical protein